MPVISIALGVCRFFVARLPCRRTRADGFFAGRSSPEPRNETSAATDLDIMNAPKTLPARLGQMAARTPDRSAFVFLGDREERTELTLGQLWERSGAVARAIQTLGMAPEFRSPAAPESPRAMLLFPPGLDFLPAFLGAQLAGWVPVPTTYPKPHRANPQLDASAANCDASVILTDAKSLKSLDPRRCRAAGELPCLAVDELVPEPSDAEAIAWDRCTDLDHLAFLQYTSGSTSEPKGVKISHRNLRSNLDAIRKAFQLDRLIEADQTGGPGADGASVTAAFWLPHFHDMGLIGGMLMPLELGFRTVLMSPQSFVQRPLRWLEAVSRFGACVTGAPNFAFDLCVQRMSPADTERLDLSGLRLLFCGAEPILPATLRRFRDRFETAQLASDCFYPCYGLAESTLLVAGGDGPGELSVLEIDRQALADGVVKPAGNRAGSGKATALVSCGRAVVGGQLLIVDPTTGEPLGEQRVGEIWLRGPSVSAGYWNASPQDSDRFGAQTSRPGGGWTQLLFGDGSHPEGGFFRTGDMGFLHEGDLYVTGRLKELLIVRGQNHFPSDIESTVAGVAAAELGRVVAVRIDSSEGESLGIIAEFSRHGEVTSLPELGRRIRAAVIEGHEIDPSQIVFVRPSSIPVTTSGKPQRLRCQAWFTTGLPETLYRWQRPGGGQLPPLQVLRLPDRPAAKDVLEVQVALQAWIVSWLVQRGGIEAAEIDVDRRFDEHGLDSLLAIRLIGDLEDNCGVELTPVVAWEHPTISGMSRLIAARVCGLAADDQWIRGELPAPQLATRDDAEC